MKIAIGCDHGGFELKNEIIKFLKMKYEVKDFGTYSKVLAIILILHYQ